MHPTNTVPTIGSDRSFGFVMAGACLLMAAFGFWTESSLKFAWAALGLGFVIAACTFPRILAPLNRAWFRFGLLLHKVVSPIVLGAIFFLVITPIGLVMRLTGRCPLDLRVRRDAKSCWVPRDNAKPSSMTNQF